MKTIKHDSTFCEELCLLTNLRVTHDITGELVISLKWPVVVLFHILPRITADAYGVTAYQCKCAAV